MVMKITDDLHNPLIVNKSEILRHNNVTVILEWPKDDGVSYITSVHPSAPFTEAMSDSTITINLTITYSTKYNFSIVSNLVCEQHSVTTTKVFNYGR